MHINNSIHYTSDPYLLSQYKYKAEHKSASSKNDLSISEAKREEKSYAKSVNALQSSEASTAANEQSENKSAAAQKAIASYAEVGRYGSSEQQFNMVEEMV